MSLLEGLRVLSLQNNNGRWNCKLFFRHKSEWAGENILQTARIYSSAFIYAFGGRSAVEFFAENVIGVQYKVRKSFYAHELNDL